ncbi:MAG: CDGSH iron-sulfur domain-containing protein [Magnetococcales bacterium]|nr:CDGSH iron-sulfur domain-containing protein [Magnetococcales bacterium]MBF0156089.1 CDGSH iron-sulfur domain-containing protein [Magnetococcales bacterium]
MTRMFENKKHYVIKAEAGESYGICTCGHTAKPPFCDGSHKAHPPAKPAIITATKSENLFLCGCGGSRNRPWCDGSHKRCPEHDDYINRS